MRSWSCATVLDFKGTRRCFKQQEEYRSNRGPVLRKIPANVHETFAEGEFNMFYMPGIFSHAVAEGYQVEVYRARHSDNPRYESQFLISQKFNPQELLKDLRSNIESDGAFGLPTGPNSGLRIQLIA